MSLRCFVRREVELPEPGNADRSEVGEVEGRRLAPRIRLIVDKHSSCGVVRIETTNSRPIPDVIPGQAVKKGSTNPLVLDPVRVSHLKHHHPVSHAALLEARVSAAGLFFNTFQCMGVYTRGYCTLTWYSSLLP